MKPINFKYDPIKITFKKKLALADLTPSSGHVGMNLILCLIIGLVLAMELIKGFFEYILPRL